MKLEELLKLKKFEKPSEAQWESFDAELKNKMLLCIVNESRGGHFRWFRFSALSASACLIFAIGFWRPIFAGGPSSLRTSLTWPKAKAPMALRRATL